MSNPKSKHNNSFKFTGHQKMKDKSTVLKEFVTNDRNVPLSDEIKVKVISLFYRKFRFLKEYLAERNTDVNGILENKKSISII